MANMGFSRGIARGTQQADGGNFAVCSATGIPSLRAGKFG